MLRDGLYTSAILSTTYGVNFPAVSRRAEAAKPRLGRYNKSSHGYYMPLEPEMPKMPTLVFARTPNFADR